MDVCFKNVRDRHLLLAGELEVAVHVRTWIEHCGYSFGIIADQIGKLGDAVGLNAFKNECHKDSFLVFSHSIRASLSGLKECQWSSRYLPLSGVGPSGACSVTYLPAWAG